MYLKKSVITRNFMFATIEFVGMVSINFEFILFNFFDNGFWISYYLCYSLVTKHRGDHSNVIFFMFLNTLVSHVW